MVSKKHQHFAAFLRSLQRSDWPNAMTIVFSHDFHASETVSQVQQARAIFPNMHQWLHPFACSVSDSAGPGQGFPRYNRDGTEVDDWQGCCVKNHWWWAANKIWSTFPRLRIMYYLEEDFLLSKHSYAAATALGQQAEERDVLGFMLQCRKNLWTVSGALRRAAWEDVASHSDFFCHFNEYNWDLSLKQTLIQRGRESSHRLYLCPPMDFAAHTGDIGRGLTQGKEVGSEEEEARLIAEAEQRFYAASDARTLPAEGITTGQLMGTHKGFGGFAHPRYQHHCSHVAEYYQRGGGGKREEGGDAWITAFLEQTLAVS